MRKTEEHEERFEVLFILYKYTNDGHFFRSICFLCVKIMEWIKKDDTIHIAIGIDIRAASTHNAAELSNAWSGKLSTSPNESSKHEIPSSIRPRGLFNGSTR